MRITFSLISRVLAASVLLAYGATLVSAAPYQEKQGNAPKVSEGERKAAQKINDAIDPAAKMQAASEFIQKYPQSSLRPSVANAWAAAITSVQDMAQRVTYAESYLNTFKEASETAAVYPALVEAYVKLNRADDAFNAAPKALAAMPNEAFVLYLVTLAGTNEVQRGNSKHLQQSLQYSQKAIELFEANQRPASVAEGVWSANKSQWLSQLYQSAALLALAGNKSADAQGYLQKAAALTPNDPMIYYMLSRLRNDEYEQIVREYRAKPAGADQEKARKTAEAKLDEVIELYARVLALTEGKEQFKQMHTQMLSDLTTYYKFRHNNSTDGMQALIDKFKTPATP